MICGSLISGCGLFHGLFVQCSLLANSAMHLLLAHLHPRIDRFLERLERKSQLSYI